MEKLISVKRTAAKLRIAAETAVLMLMGIMMPGMAVNANSVTITDTDLDMNEMMSDIIGILLTVTRFVGVALVVYGVYEFVMSFVQQQPEAKTRGIIMMLAGVLMAAAKSMLQGFGLIA